jgi:type IV secretory pathway TraG/TraD family ATPase VirD4
MRFKIKLFLRIQIRHYRLLFVVVVWQNTYFLVSLLNCFISLIYLYFLSVFGRWLIIFTSQFNMNNICMAHKKKFMGSVFISCFPIFADIFINSPNLNLNSSLSFLCSDLQCNSNIHIMKRRTDLLITHVNLKSLYRNLRFPNNSIRSMRSVGLYWRDLRLPSWPPRCSGVLHYLPFGVASVHAARWHLHKAAWQSGTPFHWP